VAAPAVVRNTVLVTTMVTTAFQLFVLAVLASVFIDEFGLSRFELGLIGSLNTAVGAVTAPGTGRITDRIGARASATVAQLIAALAFVMMAVATSTLMLVAATIVVGVPQGWGNPTTNALIAERVAAGKRGVVTGIKQSGVQVGIFLAGVTLPVMNETMGWRAAMWIYAVAFVASAMLPLLMPKTPPPLEVAPGGRAETDAERGVGRPYDMRAVWLIALYAFLMGASAGAISRFLPLFAEEELAMSNATAGLVLALSGFTGIGTRIIAGRIAEHRIAPLRFLAILAVNATFTGALLLFAVSVGAWSLWPIALLFAVGHSAWNAVAMLAIILGVDPALAGRASGTVMFGFLGGLAVSAPVAGLIIDRAGYQPVWIVATILTLLAAAVARYADRQ